MATVNRDFIVKNGLQVGGNTVLNGPLGLAATSDTATAATHYFVETGTDGIVRPKTLANVKTEIVTTAAVNAAAATTVGTITSGVWNGTTIAVANGGTGVTTSTGTGSTVLSASPTFTGTPAAPTAAVDTNTTQIATTAYVIGQGYLKSSTASSTYQPLDGDLTAIAALAGTSGFAKKTAANTWTLDTSAYLTGNQTITLSGDASGSGTTAITVTVADDSHNHIISNVDSLQTTLDAKAPLASPTFTGTVTAAEAIFTGAVDARINQNAQTGTTYTFVLADAGKLVTGSNASAITFTVPPNSSVAYPVGTKIDILQLNTGQISVAPGSGVTLNSYSSMRKLVGRYAAATLWKQATDTWVLIGNITS